MASLERLRRQVGGNLRIGLSPTYPTIATAKTLTVPSTQVVQEYGGGFVYYKRQIARLSELGPGGTTLTLSHELDQFGVGDPVELWGPQWHPVSINSYINQAITYAEGGIYEPHDYIIHALSQMDRRIALPSTMSMVKTVEYRDIFTYSPLVHNYTLWEADAVDIEFDDHDYRIRPSVRITEPSATLRADTGVAIDLSGMTHLEGWLKSSIAVTFALSFYDDDTLKGSLDLSLEAGKWLYLQEEIGPSQGLREIDNVRISSVSPSNGVFWLNGLWAIAEPSIEWKAMDNRMWEVDRQTRELIIQLPYAGERYYGAGSYGGALGTGFYGGNLGTGYVTYDNPLGSVLRIVGGADPGNLDEDDDETIVPSAFITTKATQLAFGSEAGGPQTDLDRLREQARVWDLRAEREKRAFPALINVRRVR